MKRHCHKKLFISWFCLLSLFLLVMVGVCPAYATSLEDQKSAKESLLGSISSEISAHKDELAEVEATLNELYAQLQSLSDELSQVTSELEQTNYDIASIEAQIEITLAELEQKRAELTDNVNNTYKVGSKSSLDFLLSSSDLSDLLSRVYYLNKFSSYFSDLIHEIAQIEALLESQKAELELKKAEEESLAEDLSAKIDEHEAKKVEIQTYYDSLESGLQSLYSQKSTLESEIAELDSQIQIEAAAAAAAAAEAVSANQSETSENDSGSLNTGSSSSSYGGGGVSTALAQVGKSYVYGATGPDSFDCSGLVCYCYGYARGRSTYAMISSLQSSGNWKTSISDLSYGDLVFTSDSHVGIYLGNGTMVHAANPSKGVVIGDVYSFIGGGSYY